VRPFESALRRDDRGESDDAAAAGVSGLSAATSAQ
jgi:hypothetical protein